MLYRKGLMLLTSTMLAVGALLAGCTNNLDGTTYSRSEVRQAATVETGTIRSIRLVRISGSESWVGTGAGALLGGAAGSLAGGGRGHIVAAVIGAVAGGLLGGVTQEGLTRAKGVEMTIRKHNGQEVSIVQEVEENQVFRVGDRVRLLESPNGNIRVALDQ